MTYKSRLTGLLRLPSRFRKNDEGIAAIEFAFVAPVMILMYLGLAQISLLVAEDRRVSHAANIAGDLTTQHSSVTPDTMEEIMNAVVLVLDLPASEYSKLKIDIASYSEDASGAVISNGSASLNGPFGSTYSVASLDEKILNDTSGIVVARVSYAYDFKLVNYKYTGTSASDIAETNRSITLEETFLLKPRKSAFVEIKDSSDRDTYSCSFSGGKPSCTAS